jgi:hypothetical protein
MSQEAAPAPAGPENIALSGSPSEREFSLAPAPSGPREAPLTIQDLPDDVLRVIVCAVLQKRLGEVSKGAPEEWSTRSGPITPPTHPSGLHSPLAAAQQRTSLTRSPLSVHPPAQPLPCNDYKRMHNTAVPAALTLVSKRFRRLLEEEGLSVSAPLSTAPRLLTEWLPTRKIEINIANDAGNYEQSGWPELAAALAAAAPRLELEGRPPVRVRINVMIIPPEGPEESAALVSVLSHPLVLKESLGLKLDDERFSDAAL